MEREALLAGLRGAYAAAVTPFTAAGDVDHEGLYANSSWMVERGLDGILLLGSTGEQVHLSEFERALVLEVGRRAIPTDKVMMVGAGRPSARLTIEECRRAAEAGADAALIVTPNYYQPAMNAANLHDFYRTVADASPLPILLYSVPGITNITLPAVVVAELAAHPNIVGMKNSGSDPATAAAYHRAAQGESFMILSGSPIAAPGFLLLGWAQGLIFAAANVVPEATRALLHAARAGDLAAVRVHTETLQRVLGSVGQLGIAGWKAGIAARGGYGGDPRLPLRSLTQSEQEAVAEAVRALVG